MTHWVVVLPHIITGRTFFRFTFLTVGGIIFDWTSDFVCHSFTVVSFFIVAVHSHWNTTHDSYLGPSLLSTIILTEIFIAETSVLVSFQKLRNQTIIFIVQLIFLFSFRFTLPKFSFYVTVCFEASFLVTYTQLILKYKNHCSFCRNKKDLPWTLRIFGISLASLW